MRTACASRCWAALLCVATLCGAAASSEAEQRVYETPPGEDNVLRPGLDLGSDRWLLGSWIDEMGLLSGDCSEPLLRIQMQALIDSRPSMQFIAAISGSLKVGAAFIRKIVVNDPARAQLYLWWPPGSAHSAPVGDPLDLQRLDDTEVLLTYPNNSAHLILQRCPETPATATSGNRSPRGDPRLPTTRPQPEK